MSYINNLTVHDLRYNGTRPANASLVDMIMEQMTAGQVEISTDGILVYGSPAAVFSGVSIDSRTLRPGDLFFAIRGERHDGHEYIGAALSKGASGVVADTRYEVPQTFPADRILLRVENTQVALRALAADVRRRWKGSLVAITGSMGKTTTKEFVFHVLRAEYSVYRSPGNYNNLFGLPLAVFGLSPEDHIGVFEMGMSAAGEIAEMCRVARPDIGVITNVAPVHLEFFGSVDDIARAKGELAEGLGPGGALVYNADDPLVASIAARTHARKVSFGLSEDAEVRAEEIQIVDLNETRFRLICDGISRMAAVPLGGAHYVMNALPAVALGRHYRIELDLIVEALRTLHEPAMRGQIVRFREGFTLIDDSYNSNPRALTQMIDTLSAAKTHGRRILVAGAMLELGPASEELHYQCGAHAARRGIDVVVGVLGAAKEIVRGAAEHGIPESRALFFTQVEPAIDFVSREVREGDVVLVKGSRGIHLEQMVRVLRTHYAEQVS